MSRLNKFFSKGALLAFAISFLASNANATDGSQMFRPTANNSGIMTLFSSSFVDAGNFGFNMAYNLGIDTLELGKGANGSEGDLENYLHSFNLGMGFKATSWLHLFADLGVHYTTPLSNAAENALDLSDDSEFAIGNVKVGAQVALLNSGHDGFGIGFVPYVYLPTAGENFFTDNYDRVEDEAVMQYGFKLAFDYLNDHRDHAIVNVGWEREDGDTAGNGEDSASWVTYGLGYQRAISSDHNANLFAEVFGRVNIDDPHLDNTDPIEAIAGYKSYFNDRNGNWYAGLGKGINSYSEFGAPDLRAFLGLNWSFGVTHAYAEPEPVEPVVEEVVDEVAEIKEQVVNKTIRVGKIFFATNSPKIKSQSNSTVDAMASTLNNNPGIKRVRVEGHTDSMGDAAYNKQLSQKRADSVVAYLVDKGVDSSRLEAVGYGEETPVADNKTRAGRASNRRVEFRILDISDKINLEILER